MKFLLSFLLAFAGVSQAATESFEICYQDIGRCVKTYSHNGFVSTMIMDSELYNAIDPAWIQSFRASGVTFQSATPERYNNIRVGSTIQVASIRELLESIEKMSDAELSARLNGSACFVAGTVCLGSGAAALATGGVSILLGAGACVSTVYPCIQAHYSWNKWMEEQDKKVEESKDKEASNGDGGGNGGGGGGGGAVGGGGQGGWYGPGTPGGSYTGTVVVTQAPPGPMPGSGGTQIGRRPVER